MHLAVHVGRHVLLHACCTTAGEDLDKLGRDFVEAKKSSPTHPHPEGPTTPWASKVMHPITGAMDRAADAAKETLKGDRDRT